MIMKEYCQAIDCLFQDYKGRPRRIRISSGIRCGDHRCYYSGGGAWTRLREVVGNTPKVLASVNNRPFLDIVLGYLDKWECVGKVVIAAGYMAERIIAEYDRKNRYHFQIDFSVEKELLGTGGGIKKDLASQQQTLCLLSTGIPILTLI